MFRHFHFTHNFYMKEINDNKLYILYQTLCVFSFCIFKHGQIGTIVKYVTNLMFEIGLTKYLCTDSS